MSLIMRGSRIGSGACGHIVWARTAKLGLEWFGFTLAVGNIAVCGMVVMELLWSTRDLADFTATEARSWPVPGYGGPREWAESRWVFRELAGAGPGWATDRGSRWPAGTGGQARPSRSMAAGRPWS